MREFAAATSDNVVQIRATWKNGAASAGFGYIVGRMGQRFTVATARHVIAGFVNGKCEAADLVEIVNKDKNSFVGANIVCATNPNVDLAFVEMTVDGLMLTQTAVVAAGRPARSEEVWLFGAGGEIKLNPVAGRVSDTTSSLFRVAGLGGTPGTSGAPVISARGVAGLYLGVETGAIGHVLDIGAVQEWASTLHQRWTLTPTPGTLETIAVQITRTDAWQIPLSIHGMGGARGGAIPGNLQLAPGGYRLLFDPTVLDCTPSKFVVAVFSPAQKIEINCVPRLAGVWTSADMDAVIGAMGNGDYEFLSTARNNLPSNSLTGRLVQKVTPGSYQALLVDLMKRDRPGTLTVSSDAKEITLSFQIANGETRTLVLKRKS